MDLLKSCKNASRFSKQISVDGSRHAVLSFGFGLRLPEAVQLNGENKDSRQSRSRSIWVLHEGASGKN